MSYSGFVADVAARYPTAQVRFAVEVVGIPYVFTSDEFNSSAFTTLFGSYRAQLRCLMPGSVEVGEYRLDLKQRRVTSATARFDIALDAGGIVQSLITPRAKPVCRITENLTTSETSITCTLDARAASDTPYYIGGETIRATAWSGGTITASREQYGSTAQMHFGGTTGVGAEVYASPQSWTNRRARIYAYLLDESGNPPSSSAYYGEVYAGRLMSVPAFSRGVWSFELEHDSERIASTECGLGLREINVQPELQDTSEPRRVYLPPTDMALFSAVSSEHSVALVAAKPGVLPFAVSGVGADYINLSWFATQYRSEIHQPAEMSAMSDHEILTAFRPENIKSIRHAVRLKGDPAYIANVLLASINGDQDFYGEDILPGSTRTEYGGPQFRFGAGLGVDDGCIDADNFEEWFAASPVLWDVLIDRPVKVGDILQEMCAALGLFWYLEPTNGTDAKIKFATLSDRDYSSTVAATILKADTVVSDLPSVYVEQGPALSSVTFRGSWDALVGKHMASIESVDWEIKGQYGDDAESVAIDANLASINVESIVPVSQLAGALKRSSGMDIASAESLTRRLQRESIQSRQFIAVTLPMKWLSVSLGDVVSYTDDRLPDGEGGTIAGTLCRCVGYEPNWQQGTVRLQLLSMRAGWRFAPCAQVTATTGGATPTLTVSTSFDVGSAGLNFTNGAVVYLVNTATDVYESALVASSTSTTVTLQGAYSSWTYTAGTSFLVYESDAPTKGGYQDDDFLYQCAEDINVGDFGYSEWG